MSTRQNLGFRLIQQRRRSVVPFLVFSTQPVGAASGSNMATQPVVTAKHGDGTTDTSFVGNVTVAINTLTGTPSLTGTATVTAVAGVATFSGLGTTGGASTWTLTAGATSYTSATSATGTTTGAGVTTYLSDAFSTTKAALSGTNTDTAQPWTTVGLFTTDSTNAVCSVANANAHADAGQSDGVVRWTVAQASNGWGGIFRYQDGGNRWSLEISPGTPNRIYLAKIVASAGTTYPTNIVNIADGDVVSVTLAGASITLKNETQGLTAAALTGTAAADLTGATGVGLKTDSGLTGTVKWGDISMKSA